VYCYIFQDSAILTACWEYSLATQVHHWVHKRI